MTQPYAFITSTTRLYAFMAFLHKWELVTAHGASVYQCLKKHTHTGTCSSLWKLKNAVYVCTGRLMLT